MRRGLRAIGLLGVIGALGCAGPALDLEGRRGATLELRIEPAADSDSVPVAFRGWLKGAPGGSEPWLFRGELSDYYERALRRGELSSTLLERAVPLRFWWVGDECVFQPLAWLEPGELYSLALAGHGRVKTLRALEPGERAMRFFPSAGAPPSASAVLCGGRFGELPQSLTLVPGDIEAQVLPGIFGASRADCVTLAAQRAFPEPVLAPPSLGGVLLQPLAFASDPETRADAASCAGQLVAEACLDVQDDRVFITPLHGSSLWLLDSPTSASLAAPPFERSTLLSGLPTATQLTLSGRVIAGSGRPTALDLTLRTTEPRRHLVLSEVLANALGPEPESEWVELVNDSERPVELAGVWLEDSGGRVPLPDERLAPREAVLLVAAPFRASSLDVPVPAAVRRVTLPSLGQRGLANSGEPLQLVGPEGVLSRFPMLPAPHAGISLARRSVEAADDDPGAFAEHAAPGASPGAPNFFE